jgi:two-component system, OmpR family, phosphate regulon sensor histidine kinase PhoR
MAEATSPADGPPDAPERRPHQPGFHTVIVVDDEVGIRKGCRRVLAADGHDVVTAETAEEGLEFLGTRPETDLALIDLRLPGMDGLAFISRAAEIAPETVCVVITAYATLETAIEATKRGAYDFLTKPFTPDELIRVVNKALERSHLTRERNRLQAERESRLLELSTEQSRLRGVIDCMADGVMVCNSQGDLVLNNPAALRFLPRLQPGQAVSRLDDVLEPPELTAMIAEASQGGKRLSREIELAASQGEGWVLAGVAPITDQHTGQYQGTITVLRDITGLKQVEEVKAQFVNMVAHELRAPLAAVSGYLSVMQQGLVTDPAKQMEMMGRSEARIKALLDLVSDLLDVSRMEAGTVRREIGPQQPAQIIAEVVELMTPLAAQRQITVQAELPADLPTVDADREELIRLFNNLVSNAIKYNRDGGSVTVTAAPDGHYVRLSVSDTGVGISPEGVKRLFSEFFREKRPETAYVTGTGLGLSIVKRIVDFYHGRVEAHSALGEGTTFDVWLPCKCEAQIIPGQGSG